MHHLLAHVNQGVELNHIVDKFRSGDKDEIWIPRLANDGNWIVFTADAGKKSKDGFKLPDLCAENHITHVILSGKLHQLKGRDKIGWIGLGWPLVEQKVYNSAPGSRFKMRLVSSNGGAALTIAVVSVDIQTMADREIERRAKREAYQASTSATQS